eukprot:5146265-Amphidinium_carterae.2
MVTRLSSLLQLSPALHLLLTEWAPSSSVTKYGTSASTALGPQARLGRTEANRTPGVCDQPADVTIYNCS